APGRPGRGARAPAGRRRPAGRAPPPLPAPGPPAAPPPPPAPRPRPRPARRPRLPADRACPADRAPPGGPDTVALLAAQGRLREPRIPAWPAAPGQQLARTGNRSGPVTTGRKLVLLLLGGTALRLGQGRIRHRLGLRHALERELCLLALAFDIDDDDLAGPHLAEQDLLRQHVLDRPLDSPAQRPGPEHRVVATLGEQ